MLRNFKELKVWQKSYALCLKVDVVPSLNDISILT